MNANNIYMKRACEIAFSRIGGTSPNPAVGAVIVKNDNIIGEGGTGAYGCDHAEVTAIKDAHQKGHDTTGAEIYVSLEPCSHYGKTPPCVEAITGCGIRRVYIPILDPNPVVSGSGVRKLIDSGVEVKIMHNYSHSASDLIRGFKKFILRGKPFIINKCAVTLDGRIASDSGDSKWISNEYTRLLVHKLRAKMDAVIIGGNTLVKDNPMLNVRINDFPGETDRVLRERGAFIAGRENFFLAELLKADITDYRDPLRVLIGLPPEISAGCNFLRDDNYIIITGRNDLDKALGKNKELDRLAGKLNLAAGDFSSHEESILFALDVLKGRGVMNALLEGGGTVNGSFFNAGAVDQFMYVIAPKILGSGIPSVRGRESGNMSEALTLRDISSVHIGDNLLFNGYKEEYNFEMM